MRGEGAGDRARTLAAELQRDASVAAVESAPRQVHPRAPFITSTLQQTAVNRLGFTAKRTMAIAQQLYEGVRLGPEGSVGLITYMRTDSPRLAGEAIGAFRDWLTQQLGPEYVPESPRQFKSRKQAQDAHEAVRPTAVERTPELVRSYLSDEQFKLWLTEQARPSENPPTESAQAGRDFFFAQSCANCHAIGGTSAQATAGPDLTHLASRRQLAAGMLDNTPANLTRWLKNPQQIKPGCQMPNFGLDDNQLTQLVAYLEGLR